MIERMLSGWSRVFEPIISETSPFHTPLVVLVTAIALWTGYRLSRRALRRYLQERAHKPENIENFLFFWRYAWMTISVILVLVSFSGSLAGLGLSAAFLGMVLGWSLQAPVTGVAAWLMIILKRPFRIGDRVIIAGITGDVVDIDLTHILLNQVGGTIGGEEKSGRGVLIPNAILFQQIIYNYTSETKYLLDEVPVHVTFESDIDETDRILIAAAREVTREIIDETGQEPFTRAEFTDWGVRIRLRYQTLGTDRQRVTSEITKLILRDVMRSDRVEFRYPLSEVRYQPKEPRDGDLPEPVRGTEKAAARRKK